MSLQDRLIAAMQANSNAKARASIMAVLAEEGDENAIAPLLQAINVQPLLSTNLRNDGNAMLDAALKLCQRHRESAKPYLLDILTEPEPKTEMALGVLFDKAYIAALARRQIAAYILGVLYGGKNESLVENLFNNAKKDTAE